MRLSSWILKKRLLEVGFFNRDVLTFRWYQYHNLFFNSLIFNGSKLRAFNFFCQVKYGLKTELESKLYIDTDVVVDTDIDTDVDTDVDTALDPQFVFFACMLSITPELMLKPLRLGSVTYGVPIPITDRKQITFALKWTIKLLRDKHKARTLKIPNLVNLLLASYCEQGEAFDKLQEIYKTADANRHLVRKFFR